MKTTILHGWWVVLQSFAVIGILVNAIGLMIGMVKPADAVRHIGTILGIVILFMLLPRILVNTWSGMSLWQQFGLAVIGVALCLFLSKGRKGHGIHKKD